MSTASSSDSVSIPEQLVLFEERYCTQTRKMEPYAYLIKLTEVNLDDGWQPFIDERHEFRVLAQDVLDFKTEILKTLGAGVLLSEIVSLEDRIKWLIAHLNPLCGPPHSMRTLEDMLVTLKERARAKQAKDNGNV